MKNYAKTIQGFIKNKKNIQIFWIFAKNQTFDLIINIKPKLLCFVL